MSIGLTIKNLRKQKNITQEELANMLGITSRAISQWECERTYPDISQLPLLSNIFNVTVDYLLGVNINLNNERIDNYIKEAEVYYNQANFKQSEFILRNALKEFPNAYPLIDKLINTLICQLSREGNQDYSEVIELCNNVLDNCRDNEIITSTIYHLALAYNYSNKYEEMIKITNKMHNLEYSKEIFMLNRWSFNNNEGLTNRQNLLSDLFHYLIETINLITLHLKNDKIPSQYQYTLDERIKLLNIKIQLIETLYNEKDYGIISFELIMSYRLLTLCYIEKNDTKNAINSLNKYYEYALYYDNSNNNENKKHTSLLFKELQMDNYIQEGNTQIEELLEFINSNNSINKEDESIKILINKIKNNK